MTTTTSQVAPSAFPDDATLIDRISAVAGRTMMTLTRQPFASGTFPKEIVACRDGHGNELTFFCKYAAVRDPAHGHRGGIPYEARVYREILDHLPIPTPTLRAASDDDATTAWLLLDYIEGPRLSDVPDRMLDAAAWLAEFHVLAARRLSMSDLWWLTPYTKRYYVGWSQRTVRFSVGRTETRGWLESLAAYFESGVARLLEAPSTIIHGEFTIHNVMLGRSLVLPTDWESAAIGPGEIDLMCLVDRWPSDVVSACAHSYADRRWPANAPTDLDERLRMAELYLHFRWLGEDAQLMLGPKRVWRFDRLREIAREIGVS